jgi:hypothetical protein
VSWSAAVATLYTGHMVWNRRGRNKQTGGHRANPVEDWVWSPEPAHEALVDLETFVQAQQIAERRERSRTAPGPSRHPLAAQTYPLRSYLFCTPCGRRMWGKNQRDTVYHICGPKKGYAPPSHPVANIWVREDLIDGLSAFLAERVFGRYRADLLGRELDAVAADRSRERRRRMAALRRAIADAEARRRRLALNLGLVDDPDPDLIRDVNQGRADLQVERDRLQLQLAALEGEADQEPDPALLDQLPVGALDLQQLPDALSRRLFDALRLEICYDRAAHRATCRITLTGRTVQATAMATGQIVTLPQPATTAVRKDHTAEEEPEMRPDETPTTARFCVVPPTRFVQHPCTTAERHGTLRSWS